MKYPLLILIIFISSLVQAQDFKPYGIESGKIEYENLKYSLHAGFKSVNGVDSSFREFIPYVSEQIIYYWDDYGDKAFEEIYQVSAFGGEPLAKKIKKGERLWIDEHRYYFDAVEEIVHDDPYHLRIECREKFQYYQIIGSWIETTFMGANKMGTKDLLGKEAIYYKIDDSHDMYAWEGLVLKNELFATSGSNGPRSHIDWAKIAVNIDTLGEINDSMFYEIDWLKREKMYLSFDGSKIVELLDANPNLFTQVNNRKGLEIKKNDILFFITSNLNIGKMQVLGIDENNKLRIRFTLYSTTNEIVNYRNGYTIKNNSLLEIDNLNIETEKSKDIDFLWKHSKKSNLFPQNNIGIYLVPAKKLSFFTK